MNIRFAENEIRYRVSPGEFQELKNGRYLQLDTIPLTFVVQMAKKSLAQGMALDLSCGAIHLAISPDEITEFENRLPSRSGIEKRLLLGESGGNRTLDVAFEVDIKTR